MVSWRLGIARHLPAMRLKKFVGFGELRRDRCRESPAMYGCAPNRRGLDLHPIVMAVVNWSDRHMVDERGRPKVHEHNGCGKMFNSVMVCSECCGPIGAKQVDVHDGPDALEVPILPAR
jgi:hypothetical protein